MFIGRDFKKNIEFDCLKIYSNNLRANRGWLDLLSLSLSYYFNNNEYVFTTLIDNLSEDEVIIVDSHDDIFKEYQIHFWRKDSISDIFPAIKCPSFKSEIKIFKTSEMNLIRELIYVQIHTKSIVIENADEVLSISLVYGNTVKITPWTFCSFQKTKFLDKLNERYELWEIDNCTWKPKKIRVWEGYFGSLKYTIDQLKLLSNISDAKFGVHIKI